MQVIAKKFKKLESEFARRASSLISTPPIVHCVEPPSTAPLGGQRKRSVTIPASIFGAVMMSISLFVVVVPRAASGDPLSNARAEAATIAAQLQSDSARLDQISQQYEEAQGRVQQLDSQIAQLQSAVEADGAKVQSDQVNLRHDAIEEYISNGDDQAIESLFASGNENSVVASQYSAVASANVNSAIDSLEIAKRALAAQEGQLQSDQAQAQAQLDAAASAQQSAQSIVSQQESLLSQVTGRIATLVSQQEAAENAADQASFVSRPSVSRNLPALPAAGGASAAVRAAESQIGVPYQWGGEDPGVGFDCSGLTQWSWRQAGVGIPRTAQEQYDAIAHVSLGDLEPGDLLFWGYGTGDIYHVAMYVGDGDVVQAPQTGEDVQIDPIWTSDLVGAGRP